jgi:hypothetical protein
MAGNSDTVFPFDLAAIAEDMNSRFGWSKQDLSTAMSQLMPAAMTGFRHFGPGTEAFAPFLAQGFDPQQFFDPFKMLGKQQQNPLDAGLMPFFGPEFVRRAISDQIAKTTGLQQDAIQEMMPVAATLAMGQVARPYLQGEAQVLLDAFMRGFARGRPKPAATPMDYFQGYTDAVSAFWSGFLTPDGRSAPEPDEAVPPEEPEGPEETEAEPADISNGPAAGETSEFEAMMSDWMTASRDMQSSQFEAFNALFDRAAQEMRSGSKPDEA